jgi:general L-amino acid transport system substrate-binding protein
MGPFRSYCPLIAALLAVICADAQASTNRLSEIRSRGELICGIWPNVPGFAVAHGDIYAGFDIDICRAVAAAIFGNAAKVAFRAVANIEQFRQDNDIDLVARRLTWTLGREATSGMTFGPITFYDGQGLLVRKNRKITSIAQLAGDRLCVLNTEHQPETLFDYFKDYGRETQLILVENDVQAEAALRQNRCAAYSADISWLAAARSGFEHGVLRYDILPQVISKEPLAPMMRTEDSDLIRVVRWTVFAMLEAEELGVTSQNINQTAPSSRLRRFLNARPDAEVAPGGGAWVHAIIAGVGNYAEVFDRNLGSNSPIRLERGFNRLWIDGGLMYAPPLDR